MRYSEKPKYRLTLAQSPADLQLAQALRYEVFVQEMGGGGDMVDHAAGLEMDRFDPFFDHLLLFDDAIGAVIGVYRVMRAEQAERAGQYYSEDEYDISALRNSGCNLLELGRSCVRKEYRGGAAMYHLWNGLAQYLRSHHIDIMFGTASFHGTDVSAIRHPLSYLYYNHLAPAPLQVRAHETGYHAMDLIPERALDVNEAKAGLPKLIRAYLRIGGVVGQGAFVDQKFNSIDVCMIMETANINKRQSRLYGM